jgi:hypothetical protein
MKYIFDNHEVFPVDNYFGLPNPEYLQCYIKELTASLSNFVIAIKGTDENGERCYFELAFTGTRLINAPKEGVSANFQLVSPERCLKELRTLPIFDGLPDDDLLQNRMYSVALERREVIIIAGDGGLLTSSQLHEKYGR